MNCPPRTITFPRHGSHRGMVLVVMLAMIVLVTIAVMAFFAHATSNRQVETSRTNKVEAELLSRSGADYVIGQMLNEAGGTNVLPVRALNSGVVPSNTNFFNLIRQSVPSANSGLDTNASADSTATVSRNGRSISPSRWNAPTLLTGGGFSTNSQLPNWVYVTRTGGLTNTPGTNIIGRFAYNVYDIGGLLDANVAGYGTNATDATNISRLKSSVAGADLSQIGVSNTVANNLIKFRDSGWNATNEASYLERVMSSVKDGFRSATVTNLVNTNQVFTNNYFTGRQDLLRYARTQDTNLVSALPFLTHFSRSINAPSWKPAVPSAQDPDFSSVTFKKAGKVTHYNDDGTSYQYDVEIGDPAVQHKFSLAKLAWLGPDGPNEGAFAFPPTATQTEKEAAMKAAIEACFGLRWNPTEERWDYIMEGKNVGKPDSFEGFCVLADIADEAAPREPNFLEFLNAAIDRQSLGFSFDVQQGNGMPSATAYSPETNQQKQMWDDFWCYIGSPETKLLLGNKELQILRIAASIVDSADADNYPTIFSFPIPVSAGTKVSVEQAGVEDLPYLYSMMQQGLCDYESITSNSGKLYNEDVVWVPVFINPHRTLGTPATGQPEFVRMQFATGNLIRADFTGGGGNSKAVQKDVTLPRSFANISKASGSADAQGPIDIPKNLFDSFRSGPQVMTQEVSPPGDDGGNNSLGQLVTYTRPNPLIPTGDLLSNIDSQYQMVQGFRIFSWQRDYTGTEWQPATANKQRYIAVESGWFGGKAPYTFFNELNFVMRYKTANGTKWRTYQTVGGSEKYPASGMNGARQDNIPNNQVPNQVLRSGRHFNGTLPCHDLNLAYHITTPDPRTSRGGPNSVRAWSFGGSPPGPYVQLPSTTTYKKNQTHSGAPMGFFPEAGKDPSGQRSDYSTVEYIPTNFRDNDNIYRPADAYMKAASAVATANPYRHLSGGVLATADNSRPIVLQRPFQTVAELGYVFRDQMWKTLSFFDETSADGGLLDVFATSDSPTVAAGKVSLNTRQKAVIQSLLSGSGREPDGGDALTASGDEFAKKIAEALQGYSFSSGVPTSTIPSGVPALPSFMSSGALTNSVYTASSDNIKYRRETVVRALADSTQTRTWNILIDIVAQVGSFPSNSYGSSDFMVAGEDRKWFSIAVDRFNREVVDQISENVNE